MSGERETQLVLAADAGDLTHRVARPAGPGPHPTVLMLSLIHISEPTRPY